MVDLRHPIYDCLYVALAIETGRTLLVTDDSRLVNAMRRRAELADRVVPLADWPA